MSFVNDATMTHHYKGAVPELRVENVTHQNLSFRQAHIGSYST